MILCLAPSIFECHATPHKHSRQEVCLPYRVGKGNREEGLGIGEIEGDT